MREVILLGLAAVVAATPAAAERRFTVAGFDRVRAAGPFDVEVRVGGPVAVRADGPDRAIDRLDIRSEGGVLSLRLKDGSEDWRSLFRADERLVVRVTMPSLRGVSLAGSGDVGVDRARAPAFAATVAGSGNLTIGEIETERAELSVAGSGDLTVSGRARTARAGVAGSGDLKASGLVVGDVDVSVAGSGDVALTASRTARASLVGSGNITIGGRPRCTVTRRGSGEVRCG